jgi:hypothetical protein
MIKQKLFLNAIKEDNTEDFYDLLKNPEIKVNYKNNLAIQMASEL